MQKKVTFEVLIFILKEFRHDCFIPPHIQNFNKALHH